MTYSRYNELFNNSGSDMDTIFAVMGFFIIFFAIVFLIALIFKVVSRWIFFRKCGEDGWKSLIPIYTDITLIKISGLNWWWILIFYATVVLSIIQSTLNIMQSFDVISGIEYIMVLVGLFSMLASIASLIARINLSYNIAKKFDKDAGYTALILFFEPIMFLVLGLSKSLEYDESVEVSPNGLFGSMSASKQNSKFCSNCGNKVNKGEEYCGNCGKKMR